MKLEWSAYALSDRDGIFDHIEADSPRAAVAIDDIIRHHIERLSQFPESGRPGRVEGTRELVVNRTPYIVAYRLADGVARILRILHGSQL